MSKALAVLVFSILWFLILNVLIALSWPICCSSNWSFDVDDFQFLHCFGLNLRHKICTSRHFHTFVCISLLEQLCIFYQEQFDIVPCGWFYIPLRVWLCTFLLEHCDIAVWEHCDTSLLEQIHKLALEQRHIVA